MVSPRRSSISLVAAALVAVASGCGPEESDLANGKKLYVGDVAKDYQKKNPDYQPCASCHSLARAGSTSTVGPDLDAAFGQARRDGMTTRTFQGVVHNQIENPRRNSQMRPDLVTGDDARDVAAYVASVAAQGGKDEGQLAAIGGVADSKPIAAKGGVLTIPANEQGRTLFASSMATAPAGPIELVMPNPSPLPHNIAIQGDEEGPVVNTGGTSKISADLKPGKYQYICTVPGHLEGGMKGTLTVK